MKSKIAIAAGMCLAILSLPLTAATVSLDSYWNGNAATLKQSLIDACVAAGNGGRINLSARTYTTDKELVVNRSVRIVGQGRWSSFFKRTDTAWGPVIKCQANGIEFNSLGVDGNINTPGVQADRFGIITDGKVNIKVLNSLLYRVNYGIFNGGGKGSNGLKIDSTHFLSNHYYSLWLWSIDAQPSPLWVGRLEFTNNYIKNGGLMGVNIDYGNENRSLLNSVDMSAFINGGYLRSLIQGNYIEQVNE
ncbi:MAG: hypothetical protein AAF571_08625, partial [Verrucomicrobiota bacterium]